VFCYGCNLGPRRTARSINDLDRFKLAFVNQRHITEASLNEAIATVVNTYVQFSKNANHCSSESESPRVNGKLRNKAAVGLEAYGDQHPARLADEPIHCEPSLLMKPAAGKKERGREVIRSASLPSSPRRKQSSGTQEWRRHAMRRRRSRRFFPAPNFGKVDAIMVRDEQQLAEVREKFTNNNFR